MRNRKKRRKHGWGLYQEIGGIDADTKEKCYITTVERHSLFYKGRFFGSTVLLERHSKEHCNCSYCQESLKDTRDIRFLRPQSKSKNAWHRIKYDQKDGWYYYLRWTRPNWDGWMFDIEAERHRRAERKKMLAREKLLISAALGTFDKVAGVCDSVAASAVTDVTDCQPENIQRDYKA
jgi:hypothetical protein